MGVWVGCIAAETIKKIEKSIIKQNHSSRRITKYLNEASSLTTIGTQFLSIYYWSPEMSQSGRMRCRDPLGERVVENWYKTKSQIKNYFLDWSRSLHAPTPAETHERVEKARISVAISCGSIFTPQKIHSDSASSSSLELQATPEYFKTRKMAICYQFLVYGAPKLVEIVRTRFMVVPYIQMLCLHLIGWLGRWIKLCSHKLL